MRKTLLAATAALSLTAGCDTLTRDERTVAGGVLGAGAGLLTASVLGADTNWSILAALGGAAAGALVARNQETGECAYATGTGTYRVAPCPA
jgi:uncharacterized protein YcfJ